MNSETQDLVAALLRRTDAAQLGRKALQQSHPQAPPAMLDAAVSHVFTDGVAAAAEWLATVERFLQDPAVGIDPGVTSQLLYHLYNWHQFQALLPIGREGVLEMLDDARQSLGENDADAAQRVLDELTTLFQGCARPPSLE